MVSDVDFRSVLETERKKLLDLSKRNRLLHTSRSRTRSKRLEIVDELSDEVFRRLVGERKAMSFLPVPDSGSAAGEFSDGILLLAQPSDDELGRNGIAERHKDDKLQTELTSQQLQNRLLSLYYDARTYEEEQGVKILYLAL